ncbi:type II secretion system protein N [Melaminivora sp.]|uniref:type II secretion system protein N n=1 Tax=Melaminivora sp. TaxID=1933032 RepID=UPI0028A6CCE3|nr:type II secretion system protein N [Melaminivora sp.]
MVTQTNRSWGPRLATLALWAALGASAIHWGLKLSSRPLAPLPAPAQDGPRIDTAAVARLLGAGVAAPVAAGAPLPAAQDGLVLQGVLAGTASGGGAALIAAAGQPARPYRVGAQVAPGLVLQSLSRREARLGPQATGASTLTLQLPLQPGASGTLIQRP